MMKDALRDGLKAVLGGWGLGFFGGRKAGVEEVGSMVVKDLL